MGSIREVQLDAMVEEATVDCYNDSEAATGIFTMIDENLAVPFETQMWNSETLFVVDQMMFQ